MEQSVDIRILNKEWGYEYRTKNRHLPAEKKTAPIQIFRSSKGDCGIFYSTDFPLFLPIITNKYMKSRRGVSKQKRMRSFFEEVSVEETLNRHRKILESFCYIAGM